MTELSVVIGLARRHPFAHRDCCCLAAARVRSAQTARERYAARQAREAEVRKRSPRRRRRRRRRPRPSVIAEARAVIARYEALVAAISGSGYSDNALFNAADARRRRSHEQFGQLDDATSMRAAPVHRGWARSIPTARRSAPGSRRALDASRRPWRPQAPAIADRAPAPAPLLVTPRRAASAHQSPGRAPKLHRHRTHRPARRRARHPGARSRSGVSRGDARPARRGSSSISTASKPRPSSTDAVLRYPTTSCARCASAAIPNAIRVVLDLEGVSAAQRLHALQPVPPGHRLPRPASGVAARSRTAPALAPAARCQIRAGSRRRHEPAAVVRRRKSSSRRPAAPAPPVARAGAGPRAARADAARRSYRRRRLSAPAAPRGPSTRRTRSRRRVEQRRRLLAGASARPRHLAHRHRSRPRRPRSRRAGQGLERSRRSRSTSRCGSRSCCRRSRASKSC